MIKKITLTIITTLFSVVIFSQNFDFLLNKSNENNIYDLIETYDGYISVGFESHNQVDYPYILKLDKFGQVILDSIDYSKNNFFYSSYIKYKNINLLARGTAYSPPPVTSARTEVLEIDTNLNILKPVVHLNQIYL